MDQTFIDVDGATVRIPGEGAFSPWPPYQQRRDPQAGTGYGMAAAARRAATLQPIRPVTDGVSVADAPSHYNVNTAPRAFVAWARLNPHATGSKRLGFTRQTPQPRQLDGWQLRIREVEQRLAALRNSLKGIHDKAQRATARSLARRDFHRLKATRTYLEARRSGYSQAEARLQARYRPFQRPTSDKPYQPAVRIAYVHGNRVSAH